MACAEAVRRDPGGLCATPGTESRSQEEGRSRDSGCAASWREARPWQCQSRRTGRVETPLAARTERRAGGHRKSGAAKRSRSPESGNGRRMRRPRAQSVRAACFGGKTGRRSTEGRCRMVGAHVRTGARGGQQGPYPSRLVHRQGRRQRAVLVSRPEIQLDVLCNAISRSFRKDCSTDLAGGRMHCELL